MPDTSRSPIKLRWYDHMAYHIFDRATDIPVAYVVAWYAWWTVYDWQTQDELLRGRLRSDAIAAYLATDHRGKAVSKAVADA